MQFFISFLMMQVIFVVIEYKVSHFLAIIEFNRRKSLITRFQELAAKYRWPHFKYLLKQIKLHQL